MNNHSSQTLEASGPEVWPADLYVILYLLFLMVLVLVAPGELPSRGDLLFELTLLILFSLIFITGVDEQRNVILYFFRSTYHILPILYAFRLLHFLIPAIRDVHGYYENLLIQWDLMLFGQHVTFFFTPIRTPLLTELMYYFYLSYYVVPLVVVLVIFYRWSRNKLPKSAIQKVAGGLSLGFISSYLIYMVVPARGPWYALIPGGPGPEVLQPGLDSLWYGEQIRQGIFAMEMEMYDVFPSGHTEVFLITVLLSWKYTRSIFYPVLILFLGMVVSTMYLRFHYGVDVLAGAVLAFLIVWFQEVIH